MSKDWRREQIERLTAAYLSKGGTIEKVRQGRRVIPERMYREAVLKGVDVTEMARPSRQSKRRVASFRK